MKEFLEILWEKKKKSKGWREGISDYLLIMSGLLFISIITEAVAMSSVCI